jgi:hypothetical protein
LCVYISGAQLMKVNEYRRRAADCLSIAGEISGPQNKMLLIAVAQAWLKLAHNFRKPISGPISKRTSPPPNPKKGCSGSAEIILLMRAVDPQRSLVARRAQAD